MVFFEIVSIQRKLWIGAAMQSKHLERTFGTEVPVT